MSFRSIGLAIAIPLMLFGCPRIDPHPRAIAACGRFKRNVSNNENYLIALLVSLRLFARGLSRAKFHYGRLSAWRGLQDFEPFGHSLNILTFHDISCGPKMPFDERSATLNRAQGSKRSPDGNAKLSRRFPMASRQIDHIIARLLCLQRLEREDMLQQTN